MSRKNNHSKYHSPDAFCGSAGPEELQHLHELTSLLTDKEMAVLVGRVGITFDPVGGEPPDRDTNEMVIDEAAREDFYREYRNIISSRKK